jgi:hypothetical protein
MVEQMPLQVTAVIIDRSGRRQAEDARFDSHYALTSAT